MKLDQIFKSTGRPFFYYPGFVHNFGISVNACVFLCFIGWQTYENEQDGWKSFNTDAITKETGLTVKEQATARKQLVEKGLMEEEYARLDHVLKFRITSREMGEPGKSPFAEVANAHLPKEQMGKRQNGESSNKDRTSTESDKRVLPPEAVIWNETCSNLPKALVVGGSRLRSLQARRRDPFWRENFKAACEKVSESNFCNGATNSDRAWVATFDWMLQPDTVPKVMEGKYDNRKPRAKPVASTEEDPFAWIDKLPEKA